MVRPGVLGTMPSTTVLNGWSSARAEAENTSQAQSGAKTTASRFTPV